MPETHRYLLEIASADTRASTDEFLAAQRKITMGVKKDIKKQLSDKGLAGEFNFESRKVPHHARAILVQASDSAAGVIRDLKNVRKLEQL